MSPDEWSGPVNGGWNEGAQQPYQQPPPQQPQQQPQQQPYQQPAQGGPQAWQQQSQMKYGQQGGGGIEAMLSPKLLNMGILLGGAILFLGNLIYFFAESNFAWNTGFVLFQFGSLIVFGAAMMAGTMVSSVDKFSKLGYMLMAGFALYVLSQGIMLGGGFALDFGGLW